MRYSYRDVWVTRTNGEMIGCQMSYPWNEEWETIQHATNLIHEWLLGNTPAIVMPVGFRIWNPGKIETPQGDE